MGSKYQTIDIEWHGLSCTAKGKKGDVVDILKNVSGRCQHGRVTSIMGPSGAGKTTLVWHSFFQTSCERVIYLLPAVTSHDRSVTKPQDHPANNEFMTVSGLSFVMLGGSLPSDCVAGEASIKASRIFHHIPISSCRAGWCPFFHPFCLAWGCPGEIDTRWQRVVGADGCSGRPHTAELLTPSRGQRHSERSSTRPLAVPPKHSLCHTRGSSAGHRYCMLLPLGSARLAVSIWRLVHATTVCTLLRAFRYIISALQA